MSRTLARLGCMLVMLPVFLIPAANAFALNEPEFT